MRTGNPRFGSTFAERKAARLGITPDETVEDKAVTDEPITEPVEDDVKAVDSDDETVEDKAVTAAATKTRRARKQG